MREQVHCHGAASRCCLSTPQASSFVLSPSNASWRLGRTLYWLSHHVEHFYESQQALSQCNRCPLTWKAVQIWGRLRRTFARFETLVPLVTWCTAQTILSVSLLQHLKSLRKSFSQFETEFGANVLLLKILHFFNFQKIAEGTKHTFIQACEAWWLINVAWCC